MKTRTICGALALVVIAAILILCNSGCTKNTTVTGPTDYDTVTVTRVDTVRVNVLDQNDFYAGLQTWINMQLSPMVSYFPAIGTEDIIINKTSETKYQFDLYWIAVDFDANQVYIYAGVFKVTRSGSTYNVEDVTPSGMPMRSKTLANKPTLKLAR